MCEDSKLFVVTSVNLENEESKPHLLTTCRTTELEVLLKYPFRNDSCFWDFNFSVHGNQLWSDYSNTI